MTRTYKISDAGIFCYKCGNLSHNVYDRRHLQCRVCHENHSPHNWLYRDLFDNAFIYDERTLNADCQTMHDNVASGKWRILLVCLASDKQALQKMAFFALKQPSLLTHEIGGVDGFAFISQEPMSAVQILEFERWYRQTAVVGIL